MTSQGLNSLKQHIRKTLYLHSKYHQICLNLIKPSYADHVLHTLSPSVQNFLTYILEPSSPKYYHLTASQNLQTKNFRSNSGKSRNEMV